MERYKERERKRKAKLQTVVEEEIAEPGHIDVMMSSSSAAANSSGIIPVRARTQAFEELTSSNLRGSIGRVVGHRRTASAASAASAAPADSTTSTVATVSDLVPAHIQQSMDIDTLIEAGRHRKAELRKRDTVEHQQLAMKMTSILLGIEKLRSGGTAFRTLQAGTMYRTLKLRLIPILETPL